MFNVIKESCPYQNWKSVARRRCPNPLNFHCLKDEFGRIGWVCSDPVWVEKDRCPVFNVVAKKLDTTSCLQTRCPPYNYPSNDIDVEYACRYIMDKESSTTPYTTTETDMNKNNIGSTVALTVSILVTIIVFVASILFFKCRRRQRSKNDDSGQEESIELMRETATQLPNTVRPTNLFDKAKKYLIQKRMVVITGVQGSGKTFLAKSLVHSLQNNGNFKDSDLICIIRQLHWGANEKTDIYIIDDIFYELQLYEKFKETLEALNDFLDRAGNKSIIITIPSYTWANHAYEFDIKYFQVHVDLDKREYSENLTILESLKTKYHLSSEVSERLDELQSDLPITPILCIGFPALVSWMYKQPNIEQFKKCLCYPLETMRDDISSIKNAKILEEKGKFLVLSYMCLKDGKINAKHFDKKLFESLKKRYAPEFKDEDLAKCCKDMVGYYLVTNENGCFEFDLNIMKKIVFVSLAKDSTRFVEDNCKNDYCKHVIKTVSCPIDMDTWYMECFTKT